MTPYTLHTPRPHTFARWSLYHTCPLLVVVAVTLRRLLLILTLLCSLVGLHTARTYTPHAHIYAVPHTPSLGLPLQHYTHPLVPTLHATPPCLHTFTTELLLHTTHTPHTTFCLYTHTHTVATHHTHFTFHTCTHAHSHTFFSHTLAFFCWSLTFHWFFAHTHCLFFSHLGSAVLIWIAHTVLVVLLPLLVNVRCSLFVTALPHTRIYITLPHARAPLSHTSGPATARRRAPKRRASAHAAV